MPLTEKGKEIMKSMQKQYGKKKAEKIFYASKNAGKITGVEKAKMGKEIKKKKNKSEFKDNPEDRFGKYRVQEASLGLLIGSQADKVMRKSKGARKAAGSGMFGLTGLAASKYYEKKAGGEIKKAKVGTFTEFVKGKTGAQASESEMNKLKNQYMKKLSGAVMSENEVQRLKKTMPKRKSGSPKKGEKKSGQSDKKGGDIFIKLAKSKLGLKGGGAAIKGINFKGTF